MNAKLIKGFGFIVTAEFMENVDLYNALNARRLENGAYFIGKVMKEYAPSSVVHVSNGESKSKIDDIALDYMEWKTEIISTLNSEKETWGDEEVWKENFNTFNNGQPELILFLAVFEEEMA